jgi:hypothetical protein
MNVLIPGFVIKYMKSTQNEKIIEGLEMDSIESIKEQFRKIPSPEIIYPSELIERII